MLNVFLLFSSGFNANQLMHLTQQADSSLGLMMFHGAAALLCLAAGVAGALRP